MKRLLVLALLTISASSAGGSEPKRWDGLSAHSMPKRVASLDASGKTCWGYLLSLPGENTKPPAERTCAHTAKELVSYMKAQASTVQANGIWVITTHPNAYSPEEVADIEDLKALCKKEGIPLFVCRASKLPDGWERFSWLQPYTPNERRA